MSLPFLIQNVMGIVVKWAELSKGYYYGEFLQHKPGLGCEITGETTEEEALDMLEKMLDKWHIKKTAGTPFEELQKEPWMQAIVTAPLQTIEYRRHDASPEGVLSDIQAAKTLEELKTYKLLASQDKKMYDAYCERLKYLLP